MFSRCCETLYEPTLFPSDEVPFVVDMKLLNKVSDELKKHQITLATAESCTGGLLAHQLTNISGSSAYFDRGVVSYSNTSKIELLGVPEKTLLEYGAISDQVARAMAKGIRTRSGVDIGVSTTGIAGPTGGTEEKPVGLVYIAVATHDDIQVRRFLFSGDRLRNKEQACDAALTLILEVLSNR
jgi:nicotinamide-nucleotide amidase